MTKIVSVPGINGLNKTGGCEKAPEEILKGLEEIYTSESGKNVKTNELDISKISLDNSNTEETNKEIYEKALKFIKANNKIVFLGGDHSISFATGKAFLKNCLNERKEPCLIIFDAHPDLMKPMKEPTHEEWLRALIEGGFPAQNILLIGLRNSDKTELEFIRKKGVKTMSCNRFFEDIENAMDTITEFAYNKQAYLSLDIDSVDPAFAPATGYKVPGGLSSRQIIYAVQRINRIKDLKAIDIVEINPEKDKSFDMITTKLGAKILSEIL